MNQVAQEIQDFLMHYGMPRRSGRYPWGSGEDPYQRSNRDFLGRIEELKKSGWTETPENIKKEFGLSSGQYRAAKAVAKQERRAYQVATAKSLREDGLTATEIGRKMGVNESTVREWFKDKSDSNMGKARETADRIKKAIDEKGMVDVGVGVERELGVSKEKLTQALKIIEEEGYPVYAARVEQATNKGNFTTYKVACPPGTPSKDRYNVGDIHSIEEYKSKEAGPTDVIAKFMYPKSISSNRIKVLLKDEIGPDGEPGVLKDGLIQIRRGVDDLSLGNDRYAQVRILVDDKKYIKGMAMYSDNMPDGVDILFNTNKTSVDKAYKSIKDDPDNPFGTLISPKGQSMYTDKNGKKQLSAINKVRSEGEWEEWADALPSQFLSKQSLYMAKKQLDLAAKDKLAEFDEINSLTNPTVKKYFLQSFADDCDAAAVHLKAAALPGQKYHVIIPINSIKDTEIYAPKYENGTKLALVRYPHGGIFEIPILTVNNKHEMAKRLLGADSSDAVAINHKVAEQLSGADFDGDTVMCIPTHDARGKVKISSKPTLEGLKDFDHLELYKEKPGMKVMSEKYKQKQMGIVSNLITDMTLGGATDDELAAAVRHSMVVIDAVKHKLDYRQSEIDNNISALKKKYQMSVDEDGNIKYGGASTLISRAKSQQDVLKRQGTPSVNMKYDKKGNLNPDYDPTKPEGSLIYKTADDATYQKKVVNKKTGEVTVETKYRYQHSTKMAETDDAYSLISEYQTPMEKIYANYANQMKALANEARKTLMTTGKLEYSATAKATYQNEVNSIMSKLNTALLNAPRERMAQYKTTAEVDAKIAANPDLEPGDIRKLKQQALTKYRYEVGGVSRRDRSIKITDREWEAIQAGAISENILNKILKNADADTLRQKATPRTTVNLSPAKVNRIKALSASNHTLAEIANKMGVSTSTISKYLKGEN